MLLPAVTKSKGDLDSLVNKVHHADALDLMRRIPDASIDMVLCDLPYGVTGLAWDTVIPMELMWAELKRIVKVRSAIVLTAQQPFSSLLVSSNYNGFRYEWIWQKSRLTRFLDANRMPLLAHEQILVFSKNGGGNAYYPQFDEGKPYKKRQPGTVRHIRDEKLKRVDTINDGYRFPNSILNIPVNNDERGLHPTQKPVALFEYLVKTYTQEGEIVLDMTCGSGTTAVACVRSNRQFICGDLDAGYVNIARTRLANWDPYQARVVGDGVKQLSLFAGVS